MNVVELAAIAERHPSARLVVLFGSVARGTPFRWSDADIGVLGGGLWERLRLGAEMGRALGREAHVVDLERAPEALRHEIAKYGILVREAEPGAWTAYCAESHLLWFDFAPMRRLCAEGVRRRVAREAGRG